MYGKMNKMKGGGKKPSAQTKKNMKAAGMVPGVGKAAKKRKNMGPVFGATSGKMGPGYRKGGKKMYREGGSSDINASYKEFLDL